MATLRPYRDDRRHDAGVRADVRDELPTYQELEKLLMSREGSVAAMSVYDRVVREATFNATSVSQKPNNIDMDQD